MKKVKAAPRTVPKIHIDDILPEYDFSRARPNKYAAEYARGGVVITLDPDVAEVFPTSAKANEALRALAVVIRAHERGRAKKARSA